MKGEFKRHRHFSSRRGRRETLLSSKSGGGGISPLVARQRRVTVSSSLDNLSYQINGKKSEMVTLGEEIVLTEG